MIYESPLLTEAEAASYLKMAVKTLQKWRCQRTGPAYTKLGRYVRYHKDDLDNYISTGRVLRVR